MWGSLSTNGRSTLSTHTKQRNIYHTIQARRRPVRRRIGPARPHYTVQQAIVGRFTRVRLGCWFSQIGLGSGLVRPPVLVFGLVAVRCTNNENIHSCYTICTSGYVFDVMLQKPELTEPHSSIHGHGRRETKVRVRAHATHALVLLVCHAVCKGSKYG